MATPVTEALICLDCGNVLTEEERSFYERRCESCEQENYARFKAWREGAADAELDALFRMPEPGIH